MYNQITHAAFLDLLQLYNNRFMFYANDLVKMVVRSLLYVGSLSKSRSKVNRGWRSFDLFKKRCTKHVRDETLRVACDAHPSHPANKSAIYTGLASIVLVVGFDHL